MTQEEIQWFEKLNRLPLHKKVAISPKTVDKYVEKLLVGLDVEYEPEIIPVRVEPNAKLRSCYYNVEEKVKRDGGKIFYGWAIWQSHYLCEAEHHAVWENKDGDIVCITPREVQADEIMFVPDSSRVYEGVSISNVGFNICGSPLIDDFIKLRYAVCKLYKFGTRKDADIVVFPKCVSDAVNEINELSGCIEVFFLLGNKPASYCYCKSSKPYRQCHGKDIDMRIEYCIDKVKKTLAEYSG